MSELPSLTLVTPSFNQAEYIERTIESVLSQNYPALEWIIMDALSSDGTAAILDRYRSVPFLKIVRERDRGQTDAINKGLRQGSGEIAGWLNSDDELLPGALARIGESFQAHPDAVLIYGAGRKIDVEGNVLKRVASRPFDARLLRTAFTMIQPAMFFRRKIVLDFGGLDESLQYAMDWDLALRLAARGNVMHCDDEIAALRCHSDTKTESGGWTRLEEIAQIGRANNGPLDRNFLAYHLRRLAAPSALGRRMVDAVLGRLYPHPTIMVVGWPGVKSSS